MLWSSLLALCLGVGTSSCRRIVSLDVRYWSHYSLQPRVGVRYATSEQKHQRHCTNLQALFSIHHEDDDVTYGVVPSVWSPEGHRSHEITVSVNHWELGVDHVCSLTQPKVTDGHTSLKLCVTLTDSASVMCIISRQVCLVQISPGFRNQSILVQMHLHMKNQEHKVKQIIYLWAGREGERGNMRLPIRSFAPNRKVLALPWLLLMSFGPLRIS